MRVVSTDEAIEEIRRTIVYRIQITAYKNIEKATEKRIDYCLQQVMEAVTFY